MQGQGRDGRARDEGDQVLDVRELADDEHEDEQRGQAQGPQREREAAVRRSAEDPAGAVTRGRAGQAVARATV